MEFINNFLSDAGAVFTALGLIFALLNCFLGYKLIKIWIGFAGLILGFVLGCVGCGIFAHNANTGVYFLVGAVLGVALAILAYQFFKVGIFLLGALLGGSAAYLLLPINDLGLLTFAAAGIGILVGLAAVFASKPVIILSSSISGGLSALQSAGALFALSALTGNASTIILWGGVALAVAGVAVQFITNKAAPEKPPEA